MKKLLLLLAAAGTIALTGCTHILIYKDMQPIHAYAKSLPTPPKGYAGLYLIRKSQFLGHGLKKSLYVDGQYVGETIDGYYFYRLVKPGKHVLQTESEFSENYLPVEFEEGKNYFFNQNTKKGVFVDGVLLEQLTEEQAKVILESCGRAYDTNEKGKDLRSADYSENKGSIPGPLTENEAKAFEEK